MRIFVLLAGAALLLFVLDRLALAAERRGWIYYRARKANPASLGSAMLEVQSLLEPGVREVVEARSEAPGEAEAKGDPPPEPASGRGAGEGGP
jgi:hypothetical protein